MSDTKAVCINCQRMERTYGKGATCREHTQPHHFFFDGLPFPEGLTPIGFGFRESPRPRLHHRVIMMSSTGRGAYRGIRVWRPL